MPSASTGCKICVNGSMGCAPCYDICVMVYCPGIKLTTAILVYTAYFGMPYLCFDYKFYISNIWIHIQALGTIVSLLTFVCDTNQSEQAN